MIRHKHISCYSKGSCVWADSERLECRWISNFQSPIYSFDQYRYWLKKQNQSFLQATVWKAGSHVCNFAMGIVLQAIIWHTHIAVIRLKSSLQSASHVCFIMCVLNKAYIYKLYSYESILLPPPKTHRAQGLFPKKQAVLTRLRILRFIYYWETDAMWQQQKFFPQTPLVCAGRS